MLADSATKPRQHTRGPMNELQLMTMVCESDDCCKRFVPLYPQPVLPPGPGHRPRPPALALRELMTSRASFHGSHSRTFQHDSTEAGGRPLLPSFPHLVRIHPLRGGAPARPRAPLLLFASPQGALDGGGRLSTPPRGRGGRTAGSTPSESWRGGPRVGRRRWAGWTVLSALASCMTRANGWPLAAPQALATPGRPGLPSPSGFVGRALATAGLCPRSGTIPSWRKGAPS